MYSITLQNAGGDNAIESGDRIGRLGFAASSEFDGGASRYIVSYITSQAEGLFGPNNNPAGIVFATSSNDNQPAVERLRMSSEGHFIPLSGSAYDVGSNSLRFRTTYSDLIVASDQVSVNLSSPFETLDVNGSIGISHGWKVNRGSDTTSGAGYANGFNVPLNNEHGTTLNTDYTYVVRLSVVDITAFGVDESASLGISSVPVSTSTNQAEDPNGDDYLAVSATPVSTVEEEEFGNLGGANIQTGSSYVVWYNTDESAWVARPISEAGDNNAHCLLTTQGANAIAYTPDISSYEIFYVVETYFNNSSSSLPHFMGSDFQWQRRYDNLYYNDGPVGVGTAWPSHRLHVTDDARVNNIIIGSGAYGADTNYEGLTHLSFPDQAEDYMIISNGQHTLVSSAGDTYVRASGNDGGYQLHVSPTATYLRAGNNYMAMRTNSTLVNEYQNNVNFRVYGNDNPRLFCADAIANRIGIQTTEPTNQLDVYATGVHEGITIRGTNAPGLTIWDQSLDGGGSKILEQNSSTHSGVLIVECDYNNVGIGSYIDLRVDGDTKMVIMDDGQVGIGVSTPALAGDDQGLHIHAPLYPEIKLTNDTTLSTSDDGSVIQVVNSEFRFTNREDGKNISFYAFDTGGTSRQKLLLSESYIVVNGSSIDTDFQVKGVSDDHLIYTDALNNAVGIGTSQPSYKLDVAGSGRFVHADGACGLLIEDSAGSGIHIGDCAFYGDTYAGIKHSNHTGSEYMLISQGDHTFMSAASGFASIIRGGRNSTSSEIRVNDTVDGGVGVVINNQYADRDVRIHGTGDPYAFYVDASSDSVGIGTNLPSSKFTVAASNEEGICIHTSGASAENFKIGRKTSNGTLVFKGAQSNFSGYEFRSTIGGASQTVLQTDRLTGAISFNDQFTFPTTDGSDGQSFVTDGAGNVSWGGPFATPEYIASRGENLLTNGTAYLGDNTNFSALTFDGSEANNSPGSFSFTGRSNSVFTDEFMPVLAYEKYNFTVDAKSLISSGIYYMMTVCYDIDELEILARHHMYIPNTLTTLAQDLNDGDTEVVLTDASNWINLAGTSDWQRSFIFWNYTNSFGYQYPVETYSRNWYRDYWADSGVNYTTNTITLRSPWANGSIPSGTEVSNGTSGNTYKYNILLAEQLNTSWTTYTGTMEGIDYTGTNLPTKFSPGTAKIKLGWLMNWQGTANNTAWFTNMSVALDLSSSSTISSSLSQDLNLNTYDIVGNGNIAIDGNITAENFYGDLDGVVITECRNDTGSTIAEGTPVYVAGYYSSNGKPLIAPADSANSAKMPAIGLLASDLPTASEGHVHVFGLAQNLPSSVTNGFSVGDTVYVDIGGGLTNVRPTGVSELVQNIGRVLKTGTNGRILVLGPGRSNDVPNSGHFEQLTVDGYTALAVDNGDVGIGTASPATKLHIAGDKDAAYGHLFIEDTTSMAAGVGGSIVLGGKYSTAGDTARYGIISAIKENSTSLDSKSAMVFYTNDQVGTFVEERMRITSGGNVGIGTDSPSEKLHLSDPTDEAVRLLVENASGVQAKMQAFSSGGAGQQVYVGSVTDAVLNLIQNNVARMTFNSSSTNKQITINAQNEDADFQVRGVTDNNVLRTDAANGRVGVGIFNPSEKLDVSGGIGHLGWKTFRYIDEAGPNGSSNGFAIKLNDAHGTTLNTEYHYRIRLTTDGTATATGSTYLVWYKQATASWEYRVVNWAGSSSNHCLLAISGSNAIAYTNHPSTSYDIHCVIESYHTSNPYSILNSMGSDYQWQRYVDTLYYNDGSVSIGRTSPNADTKMEVVYDPTDGPYGIMVTKDGHETTEGVVLGDVLGVDYQGLAHVTQDPDSLEYMIMSSGQHTFVSANSGSDVLIRAGANSTNYQLRVKPSAAEFGSTGDLFRLDSDGAVFNEGGADIDFRVEGDVDQNLLFVHASGDNVAVGTNTPLDTVKFQIQNQGSTAKIYSQIIGGNNKGFGLLNNQSVIDTMDTVNGFYSYMFPSTNGNVTSMYHFRADPPTGVAGTVSNQAGFYAGDGLVEGNSNYGFYGYLPSGTNNYNIYMGSSAKNFFNGHVGIGTDSPNYKLDVKDDDATSTTVGTNILARLESNATNADGCLQFSDGVTYASLIGQQNGDLYIVTGGSERLRVNKSGSVNILSDLLVDGDLAVNGTTVYVNVDKMQVVDPIIHLGLSSGNVITNTTFDRGIALELDPITTAFMGYDVSASEFVLLDDATGSNNDNNYGAGTYGDLHVGGIETENSVLIEGGVGRVTPLTSTNHAQFAFVGGGSTYYALSSTQGYIKITLPVTWNNTFMSFEVDIYESNSLVATQEGLSTKILIGGYNYSPGNVWLGNTAHIISAYTTDDYLVEFGHDGTNNAIYISKNTVGGSTSWSYPTFSVSNIKVSHNGGSFDNWDSGWNVSLTTSKGTISGAIFRLNASEINGNTIVLSDTDVAAGASTINNVVTLGISDYQTAQANGLDPETLYVVSGIPDGVVGSGTAGTLPVFTATNAFQIEDSIVSQNGNSLFIDGSLSASGLIESSGCPVVISNTGIPGGSGIINNVVSTTSSEYATIVSNNQVDPQTLYVVTDAQGSLGGQGAANYVARFTSANVIATGVIQDDGTKVTFNPGPNEYSFPTQDGSSNQILVTDGNGNLSFQHNPAYIMSIIFS